MDSNIDSAFSLLAFCVVFLGIRIRSTSPIFAEKRCISFISYIKPQQAFSSMTLPNICFNPRTHTGCDISAFWMVPRMASFNPRTHTGCDQMANSFGDWQEVSIHAPTRGATLRDKPIVLLLGVSIHAPTRGATVRRHYLISAVTFQSTHPHGVRLASGYLQEASGWFQSTHPHGVRRKDSDVYVMPSVFQSTHPHGVRPLTDRQRRYEQSFNPRTHTGCDCELCTGQKSHVVSIHAPTRGATPPRNFKAVNRKFQSTHPHGVRLASIPKCS